MIEIEKQTYPHGVEGMNGPLRQGRLISFVNRALPTDQPRWGCFLPRLLHYSPLYFFLPPSLLPTTSLLAPSYFPPYYLLLPSLLLHLLAFASHSLSFCLAFSWLLQVIFLAFEKHFINV